jgi:hypothetical protein
MPVKLYQIVVVSTLLLALMSCETGEVFGPSPERTITATPWVLKRFEYTQDDETLFVGCNLYHFHTSYTYLRSTCEGDTISQGPWEFQQDRSYIKIGPNTFKIVSLSQKVMTLRYGDVELCFLPVK